LVFLIGGLALAIKLGLGSWQCACCTQCSDPPSTQDGLASAQLPLAANDGLVAATSNHNSIASASSSALGGNSQVDLDLESKRLEEESKASNEWKRNLVLSVCFVGVTAQSVYTGTHVLTVDEPTWVQTSCIVATLLCMNVEFLLVKQLVDAVTRSDGVLLPGLHEHELFYSNKVSFSWCQVCRERIGPKTGGYEGFNCTLCENYWLCLLCYRKEQTKTNTTEGILRGDKGPKPAPDITAWQYFRRSLKLLRGHEFTMFSAFFAVLGAQAMQVTMPTYRGNVINALINDQDKTFRNDLTIFVFLSVGASLFGSIRALSSALIQRQISIDSRRVMFESLMRQDVAFFDGTMSGQLTSRMSTDVAAMVQPVQSFINRLIANLLSLAGGTFMCFFISWKLTVLASTLIGPVIYVTRLYANWSRKINLKIRLSMADANAVATEAMRNIRTVRSFGATWVELNQFRTHMDSASSNSMKDTIASAGVSAATFYLNFATSVLILWYGGLSVLHAHDTGTRPEMSIGQLITFNLYWDMMSNSFQGLNGILNLLIRAGSAAQRVFEIMDLEPDIKIDVGANPEAKPYHIEFRDVHFTYQMRPDKKILRGLTFAIAPGQTVAVVGRSGAGKSTLVSLLLRFYDPQEGALILNGKSLCDYNLQDFMRRVGVVSQDTQVFCRPIYDNLIYGLQPEDVSDERVQKAARMANAHEFIVGMDQGYKSMIGEGGVRLSGGQKQRLAIARALLRRPSLLLLDEATSALDAENEGQVQAALDELVQSMAGACSVLLIAHRLSTVMNSDKIVVVDKGQVVEQGTHQELLHEDKIYAQLVKRQLSAHANVIPEKA